MRDASNSILMDTASADCTDTNSCANLPEKNSTSTCSNNKSAVEEPEAANGVETDVENGLPVMNGVNNDSMDVITTVDDEGTNCSDGNGSKESGVAVSAAQPMLFDVEDDHEVEMVKIRENLVEPTNEETDKTGPDAFSGLK